MKVRLKVTRWKETEVSEQSAASLAAKGRLADSEPAPAASEVDTKPVETTPVGTYLTTEPAPAEKEEEGE